MPELLNLTAGEIDTLHELFLYISGLCGGWTWDILLFFFWLATFFFIRRVAREKEIEVLFGSLFSFVIISGLFLALSYIHIETMVMFIVAALGSFIFLVTHK